MRILVIDDNPLHQESARQTLGDHEVTVVGTYDEAFKLLEEPEVSFDAVLSDLLMPASRMKMGDKGMKYVGKEMPVGFALAFMAVLHGVKYVAVATDTNHHDHPASAMLDSLGCPFIINGATVHFYHSPMMLVEGTTCLDCGGAGDKQPCLCVERTNVSPETNCRFCRGSGRMCWTCQSSGKQWGKDWGRVLSSLTSDSPSLWPQPGC